MKRLFLLFFLLSYFHSSSIYIYIGQREKKFSADDKRYIYCKSRARLYVVLRCGDMHKWTEWHFGCVAEIISVADRKNMNQVSSK